ncbi:hypothetical protein QQY24_31825 [Streptomyces sp. TG1A-8]|uniref:hypothetical protein n=1 Tax=Streptomyces sp. TG1A-8 TaxID=3051385 RepID=UPI00265BDD5E|nr:hypothetical protein [Streptomyces sp. TG1A-8]MDO0929715.1 hypothetical protein [Streptomyces sp. TG1A-8]
MRRDLSKQDRARAFVPELIPDPQDLDRTGPLDAREQRDLERIHAARDHHQAAKWMRGKALEAAFRRRLYRGEDGQRTRQEYLNDEWDGISESAAYLEIKEWRLAAQISATCERPAPDSHVRALIDAAEAQGCEAVAHWYAELRRHGMETGRRVTAQVVANLADYLLKGSTPELDGLFAPQQLPSVKRRKLSVPAERTEHAEKGSVEPVSGRVVAHGGDDSFQNFGMSGTEHSDEGRPLAGDQWVLGAEHVKRLSAWLVAEAQHAGISPERAADLLIQALSDEAQSLHHWIRVRAAL